MMTVKQIAKAGPGLDAKSPSCKKALIFAYQAMIASGNFGTASTLRAIILQKGCLAHVTLEDQLTSFMDEVIFG